MFKKDDQLRYALAKQVPDMARGFTISTSYGDIEISSEDAPRFVQLTRLLLINQLAGVIAETRGDIEGALR
jgi:hypothetical protein